MHIPEEKVSEILHAADIVDVISESVILKKSGRNFFGLCPFHSEKTPSFSVHPAKQIFHCFGCGAGGNVSAYLMKYHGVSFPEAIHMLARKYRIDIDFATDHPVARKTFQIKESLFRLNKSVMEAYHVYLKTNRKAEGARQYLQTRGLGEEMIDTFKLGFAPNEWDFMVHLLKRKKITKKTAAQSGLVLEKKGKDGYYDRFRNRIIFPIFDINMQVAGFGGRVMDSAMPKYMNSPETPVYVKSRILYGLHAAKPFCRQEGLVYIVEGYFDFLSLYQHGVQNCVASLGTALTTDHVRILKGYAEKMILVFDSDTAGIQAAKRSIQIFLQEGVDVRIMVLPKGHDPDSYVLEHGKSAFVKLASKAGSVMRFLLDVSMNQHGDSIQGKVNILRDMIPHLMLIQDGALRSLHIKDLAETLHIDEKAILEKIREESAASFQSSKPLECGEPKETRLLSDRREGQIISLMLNHPEIIHLIRTCDVIRYFDSKSLKDLGEKILTMDPDASGFVNHVQARLDNPEDQKRVAQLAMTDDFREQDVQEAARTLRTLANRIIRVKKKQDKILTNKIIEAEKECNSELFELLRKKQEEIRQLHDPF